MRPVSQVMTRGVRAMLPTDTLVKAAQTMEELDVGVLPVCDGDRLVGMVTDRDIVVRGVAHGCSADSTRLAEVMSADICCCYEDQSVDEATDKMRAAQIRRIPVLDHQNHLVGMLSLGDVAVRADEGKAGEALEAISEPSRPDRSGQSRASGTAGGGSSEPSRH